MRKHMKPFDWSSKILWTFDRKFNLIIIRKYIQCKNIDLLGVALLSSIQIKEVTFDSSANCFLHLTMLQRKPREVSSYSSFATLPLKLRANFRLQRHPSFILECSTPFLFRMMRKESRLERVANRFHRMLCEEICISNFPTPCKLPPLEIINELFQ